MKQVPPPGSLQEWVLILYLDRLEDIEHAKFRALVQVVLTVGAENQEAGVEAFEDYMNKAFPNLKTKKKKKHDQMLDALKEWVGRGPFGVTPLSMPAKAKSKMVSRISGVEKGAAANVAAKVGWTRTR